MGGPVIPWRGGRTDKPPTLKASEIPPNGRLPDATQGSDHLRAVFYRMGFDDKDIVALSGAHALGGFFRIRGASSDGGKVWLLDDCSNPTHIYTGRCHPDRSGFDGPWTFTPTKFTNQYFIQLKDNVWTPKKWNGPLQYEDPTGSLMMLPTGVFSFLRFAMDGIVVTVSTNKNSSFFRTLEMQMRAGMKTWRLSR